MPRVLLQLADGGVQIEAVFLSHCVQVLICHAAVARVIEAHGVQPPLPQGQMLIREHRILADDHVGSQPIAQRTGAEGAIEGEHPGRQLLDGDAALRAGVIHGEQVLTRVVLVQPVHDYQPRALGGGGFDIVGQPLLEFLIVPDDKPIHHHLDGVLDLLVQGRGIIQLVHGAIDAHPDIATLGRLFQDILMLPLPGPHHGGKHLQPGALRIF